MNVNDKAIELYKRIFPSRLGQIPKGLIDKFVKEIYPKSTQEDIAKTQKDFIFTEKLIIEQILSLDLIETEPKYLSLYAKRMNASVIKSKTPTIICDELLQYTLMSFYLTIYSLYHDGNEENFARCFKNFIVLLDLQGNRREIGVHNFQDLIRMCKMPSNLIEIAMDTFWVSWTFILSHEMYHAICNEQKTPLEEELEADKFAYLVLMNLIQKQNIKEMPDNIAVFFEYLYLAPMMLLDYFKLLDFYNALFGRTVSYIEHPSPEHRQEKLFELFDELASDSFNTEVGNNLYNIFLDQVDLLKDQLEIKKQEGKLDFLSNI